MPNAGYPQWAGVGVDPGRSSELTLIRSSGRNYEQDMIFLPLKVSFSHEQAEQGTEGESWGCI